MTLVQLREAQDRLNAALARRKEVSRELEHEIEWWVDGRGVTHVRAMRWGGLYSASDMLPATLRRVADIREALDAWELGTGPFPEPTDQQSAGAE